MVKGLGLLGLSALMPPLALAPAPTRAQPLDQFAGQPLQSRDPVKELGAAQDAVNRGGGADAYAARGDAKRSLGRPFQDFVADYAEAARRDPKKYGEKFRGIIEQQESETKRQVKKYARGTPGEKDANFLSKILFVVALTPLVLVAGLVLIRGRARSG